MIEARLLGARQADARRPLHCLLRALSHELLLFLEAAVLLHGAKLGLNVCNEIRLRNLVGFPNRAEILCHQH